MSDLSRLTAAPRMLSLAGSRRLVSRATLGDHGAIDEYLEAHAGCRRLGDPGSVEALLTAEGFAFVAYLALRRHAPGLTPDDAAEVALGMDAAEIDALIAAFFRPRPARGGEGRPGDGPRRVDWPRIFDNALKASPAWTPADVAALTADQYEVAMVGKLSGAEDDDGEPLTFEQAQAMWEEARARRADGGEGGMPGG